ncbi:MAG: 3-methyl-2-oxobutanoate hydroxymethyltransferase [Chitinivibrionales bacterium]|nr:3-methyl-2-oxobutanoate hydroxymethyltransferase [Chitinivibrionales bacterium]MBD3357744.1 3-methyl-2-oxobutanoate hydroxymethyltransferase [Chitinivibrionales bacterium]
MDIRKILRKNPDHKITMLTCYDFPTARALDASDLDIVFVGDSVGTNILGYRSELEVTLDDMVHHLKAVRKGVTRKALMVDLPYMTYTDREIGVRNSRVMRDKGADIVKLEGGKDIAEIVSAIAREGIPVMGHLGFQPQIARGAKRAVVGALSGEAIQVYEDAVALEQAGACGIVLECVPEDVAKAVTERLSVPTIGIGSGKFTDGQVLVAPDVLGWFNMPFRFVRRYDEFYERTIRAANRFVAEVTSAEYPQRNHGFRIKADQFEAFVSAITSPRLLKVRRDEDADRGNEGGAVIRGCE